MFLGRRTIQPSLSSCSITATTPFHHQYSSLTSIPSISANNREAVLALVVNLLGGSFSRKPPMLDDPFFFPDLGANSSIYLYLPYVPSLLHIILFSRPLSSLLSVDLHFQDRFLSLMSCLSLINILCSLWIIWSFWSICRITLRTLPTRFL